MKIKIDVDISNIFNKSRTLQYLQMFGTTGKKLISFSALELFENLSYLNYLSSKNWSYSNHLYTLIIV